MIPSFLISTGTNGDVLEFLEGDSVRGAMTLRSFDRRPQDDVIKSLSTLGTVISPRQVHGVDIVTDRDDIASRAFGDGVILTSGGYIGTIQVADCYPVLLSGSSPAPWRLLLHSGFKGTVDNIVLAGWRRLLEMMDVDVGLSRAWIGPGIGPCCYSRRIDDPWTDKAMCLLKSDFWRQDGDSVWFDMAFAIRSQIEGLGIDPKNIAVHGECTLCNSFRYLSYRSGDKESRMVFFSSIDATFDAYL